MPSTSEKVLYPELSYVITGAIYEVWNNLGPAFKEIVYQKALEKELRTRGLVFKSQESIPISFKGEKIGVYVPDFIIDDKILLEIKHLPFLSFREKKQAWNYLKGSRYKLLILVNFGGKQVEINRWIYDKARKPDHSQ